MTVETLICADSYVADGTATARSIGFPILDPGYLLVWRDGAPLTLGADYSITGDFVAGMGSIVPSSAWASGAVIRYARVTAKVQRAAIPPGQPLPSRSIEQQLDRTMQVAQELGAEADRSIKVPQGEIAGDIAPLEDRAGLLALFTADGGMTGIHSFTPASGNVLVGGLWDPDGIALDAGEWGAVPSPLPVEGGVDVAKSRISMPRDLYGESALVALASGEYLWDNFNKILRVGDGVRVGGWEYVPNAGARVRSLFDFMTRPQILDVTSGDPQMDVAACFQAMVDFCHTHGLIAHIPQIFAKLGQRIISKTSVTITCDSDSILHWTDLDDCGWRVTGQGMGERPGYCTVELPQLVGPNDISGYEDGSKIYSVAAFEGIGFQADDCIWSRYSVQQSKGWGTSTKITNTTVPTDNNRLELGTIDLCKYGLMVECPADASKSVGQSHIRTDNIFALFPIYFKAPSGSPGVFELKIDSLGLTVAETGGTTIYHEGSDISDCRINSKARNGYAPNDSPAGTPTTMRGPIVGGDGVVGAEGGWAVGTRNHYRLHLDDFEPEAGDPIAIKMRGPGSRFEATAPQYRASNTYASLALSTTQGEANFSGGVGGAAIHALTRVNVSVTALAAGASQTFYFYHQGLNADNILPLRVAQIDNTTSLVIRTENNGPAVPREAKVIVFNPTAGPITQVVNLWLEV